MSESDPQTDWREPADRERDIAPAQTLREQASQGGLRFDVFLPPSLAEWVRDLVARGMFVDPSEAVFVMLGAQRDPTLRPAQREVTLDEVERIAV